MTENDLRLHETITVGSRQVTLYELTAGDLRNLFQSGLDEKSLESLDPQQLVETLAPLVCDLDSAEIWQVGLSGLTQMYDALVRVNPGFFDLARRAGLTEMAQEQIDKIRAAAWQIWSEVSVALSDEDTSTPLDTD